MKKWFKNLILILTLCLTFNNIDAQGSITINNSQYNQWILSNPACVGCSSFYLMVVNNPTPNNKGNYFYDIYIWTNSSYRNGFLASTYLKNINLYMVGGGGDEIFILNIPYAVAPPKTAYYNGFYYLAYVYSFSASQTIKVTWSTANPW